MPASKTRQLTSERANACGLERLNGPLPRSLLDRGGLDGGRCAHLRPDNIAPGRHALRQPHLTVYDGASAAGNSSQNRCHGIDDDVIFHDRVPEALL